MTKTQLLFGLSIGLILSAIGITTWQQQLTSAALLMVGLGLCALNLISWSIELIKQTKQNIHRQAPHALTSSNFNGNP
ncbi:hypothetical protein ACRRS0_13120 [Agarivorans sp. QJM3NY_29]|uniref:hypothetical protein n=1 Tax=unclassified Agarivorans TaxID=2636026 RepID=UPI003D7C8E6B